MSRKCPYCGEPVPSFSINCPKCYRSIPREEERPKEDIRKGTVPNDRAPSVHVINMRVVLILALIPAAIGFMGMGQIYEREYRKGLYFFIPGFLLFVSLVAIISSYGSFGAGTFLAVAGTIFLLIIYIGLYAVQAFDAIVRSIIPVSVRY